MAAITARTGICLPGASQRLKPEPRHTQLKLIMYELGPTATTATITKFLEKKSLYGMELGKTNSSLVLCLSVDSIFWL